MESVGVVVIDIVFKPALIVSLSVLLWTWLMNIFVCLLTDSSPVRPTFHYRPSSLSFALLNSLPQLTRQYRVPWWSCVRAEEDNIAARLIAVSRTISAAVVSHVFHWLGPSSSASAGHHIHLFREYLPMNDQGLVSIDWVVPSWPPPTARPTSRWHARPNCANGSHSIVLVVPGRFAADSSGSLMPLCRKLMSKGHRPVIFNQRGCRGTPLSTARLPPFGDSSDLRQVLQHLKSQQPLDVDVVAIGMCTGASLIVSYLGEYGSSALIRAAVAISPIWDLETSYQQLNWFVHS